MTCLCKLIHNRGVQIHTLASHLDALPHRQRLKEVRALGWRSQHALFKLSGQGPPMTLEQLVPAHIPDQQQVIHYGRNTFPVFRQFEKRFCRPPGETSRIFGYNEGPTRPAIGPGYFQAYPTADNPAWGDRGAVVIDYFLVPDAPAVPGWPAVVPNSQGGQRFVFNGTRDFMRRVSDHVSIGRAWKGEKKMPAYFVLCRED